MNRQHTLENPPDRLALHLLGPPKIQLNNTELRLTRRKVLALLAYLVVTGQSHSRDELTFLLYPKQDRTQAQSNFRGILSCLQKAVGVGWVAADRSRVTLTDTQGLWIDTREFRRLLQQAHKPGLGTHKITQETLLSDASRLYRGRFLEGFYLKDSLQFEEWLFFMQEDFQEQYAYTQRQLLDIYSDRGEFDEALECGRRLLKMDNLDETVHRRLMKLYHLADRRSAALRQYEDCRKLLARELGETPDEETERLFTAIQSRRKVSGESAGLTSARLSDHLIPSNLPADLDPFIGREREIGEVTELIQRRDVRILTLTGAGGAGKTRLAVRVASEVRERFEDGVFFVDLSPLSEPAQVVPAIAATLDIRATRGQDRPIAEILKHNLRDKSLLLLLDTFEHLKGAVIPVREILDASPGCKVLATSREVLPISGQWDYPVPPLGLPEAGAEISAERLIRSEAVRLLEARGAAVRPDFAISEKNAAAIAEICQRLDGLPLAIELAASRLRILSEQDLVLRLTERFKVLRDGDLGLPARQQTLYKTIDWSYQLLSSEEKRLFAGLSVFSGGCNLEAAETVCAYSVAGTEPDVLSGLVSLADKSLVVRAEIRGETRIRMLDTILEYAALRLGNTAEAEEIRQRHALYYLELAEKAEPGLYGPDQMAWLERLEQENRNFHKAASWLLSSDRAGEAIRLGTALTWFRTRFGHFSEGADHLEKALRISGSKIDSSSRARAIHALGWLTFAQGRWLSGQRYYRESLELFRKIGDRRGEGMVLSDLGVADRWIGDVEAGTRKVEQAVAIAREQKDPLRMARSLIWAYSTTGGKFSGEPPEAQLQEAWELSRSVGDLWCMAHAHQGLGDLHGARGEYAKAQRHYSEALKGFQDIKDHWLTAWTFQGIGQASYRAGEYRRAEHNLGKSLDLFNLLGDRGGAVIVLASLGLVFRARGQHPRAASILGATARIQDDLLGAEAVHRIESNPELAAAQEEYQVKRAVEWAQGQAMSYKQAVEYARRLAAGSRIHRSSRPESKG